MPTTSKQCLRCPGALSPKRVEHPYWDETTLIAIVEDVPSWVCQVCGYQYFEPAVEMTLRENVKDYENMGAVFPIPRTQYRELARR